MKLEIDEKRVRKTKENSINREKNFNIKELTVNMTGDRKKMEDKNQSS
jgi:hypothetical protein